MSPEQIDAVVTLPSRVMQLQAVSHQGDYNSGPHVRLFALLSDGSVWCQYQSSGGSNVPVDGRWHNVVPAPDADNAPGGRLGV